jgi:hypothetical protein
MPDELDNLIDELENHIPEPLGDFAEPEKPTAVIVISPETNPAIIGLKAEITKLKGYAIGRVIDDDKALVSAGDDLVLIAKVKKALTEKLNEYAKPIKTHLANIQDVFKPLIDLIAEAETVNKAKVKVYIDAQKARAAEAERLNQEALELAQKQAAFSGTGEITVDLTTLEAPAPVKKIDTGSGTIADVKAPNTWVLEDWDLVPKEYKLLDLVRIGKVVRAGGSIPGIKVIANTTIRTNTR